MLNGNSGYGAYVGNSVTGTDRPPTMSLVTWMLPVTVWNWQSTTYGNG